MTGSTAFNESLPATAESVPRGREAIVAAARRAGADDETLESIRLAASEALTNAVVHAYAGGPGEVHVTASGQEGEFWMLIADDGCGLSARSPKPGLGMGLALIACVSDYFAVLKRSSGGTEIRMRFGIGVTGRPAGGYPRGSVASASAPA